MAESKKGTQFYAAKGKRMVPTYIKTARYTKLKRYAKKQGRSMQFYAEKALNRLIDSL